jgi:hypothetical protein
MKRFLIHPVKPVWILIGRDIVYVSVTAALALLYSLG